MQDYYVVSPFEIMPSSEVNEREKELRNAGRKVLAVICDCQSEEEASRKYFSNLK